MNRNATFAVSIAAAVFFTPCLAAEPVPQAATPGLSAAAPAAMSEGEVRKVDKETGKLTIRHGPLANLDMPGMTMVFHVKDPAMLDQVKEGDRIQFVAERINGAITVVQLKQVQ